ncbi:toprim domain-containing protein [Spiroplasma sp. SV19]|uniref:toprim domain-containing protein n=1 Tax=Spiroplasma sp. SV19 TaxID=2570468 RepID=UPI0024B7B96A|nr:toprim domain-containing protein [Spiroplasma sp. SV19]
MARYNYHNELISVFKNRIMIPIKNANHQVVGFSGRDMTNESSIKYLNTAETPVFTKSNILFNLNKITKEHKEITLVEGYMDVISLFQKQIPAIALMGTNLSKTQIEILTRRFNKINVFLDNDDPGKVASQKITVLLSNRNVIVRNINNNTQYKDPDEICQSQNPALLKDLYYEETEYELG